MSGYPSLISPLMDEQGLILTEALNTDAQTALALSATNQADIIVLQETALQLSGDPATYTGLPDTNMSLNGNLNMNVYDIENVNDITAAGVSGNSINVKNVDGGNYYNITGNLAGIQVMANLITPGNITCNTLNYTALNPPVSGINQNIEQVLTNGDDANGRDLTGLNNLSSTFIQSTNAGATAILKANNIGLYNDNGNTQKAVITADGNYIAQNYYLYGIQPFDFAITNNKNILTTGTITTSNLSVGATLTDASGSVGTAGQVLSSTVTGTRWIDQSSGGGQSLGDVMTVGNSASTDLNMNLNDIIDAGSLVLTDPNDPAAKVIQSLNINGGLIFKNQDNEYADLQCNQLTAPGIIASSVDAIATSKFGNFRLLGYFEDGFSSKGTSGQILSSTGTETKWVNPPSSSTPSLSDVMTVGNTANTILNMNNNTVDNAFSVYTKTLYSVDNLEGGNIYSNNLTIQDGSGNPKLTITPSGLSTTTSVGISNGTTNVIQSVNPSSQALEFIAEGIGYATLRCDSLTADGVNCTNSLDVTNNATVGGLINNGLYTDASASNGTAGQLLSSTGTATAWVDAPVSNPTLGDVMTNGNTASTDLDMNSNDITNAVAITATGQVKGRTIKSDEESKDDAFSNKLSTFRVQSTGQVYGYTGTFSDGLEVTSGAIQLGTGDVYLATNNIIVSGATGNITTAGLINGTNINFRPSYDYYVAKNGSNTNSGSVLSPFLTIQKAIDVCEAFTDNVPRNINIYYGSYSENLTISKSRISFNGSNEGGSRADTGCSINGTITINVSSGLSDMNNNNIYFNNLLINGLMSDTSTVVHRVAIKNCYLYGNDTLLSFSPSVDYRLFVDYCYLNNEDTVSNNSLVSCLGSGMVSFSNNQITTKSKGHVVHIGDSCRIDVFALNVLTNSNNGADVLAICKLGSSVNNTAYTLGQNAFIYSSTTSKSSAAPYFSCGILMDPPATKTNFYNVISNTFLMTGLNNSLTNFAITGTRNASSFAYIFYGNNTGISSFLAPYSYQIDNGSGISKNALLAVQ